jgi:methylenetetrahydrofolate dehydrogenase (NADP+)/methenyltetrahydrofolate cyclohydrolase
MKMSNILNGKQVGERIRRSLAERIAKLPVPPRLEVVVAAEDPASQAYVKMKRKWGLQIGITGDSFEVNSKTTQAEVQDKISELNNNKNVHGILVQHPLPKHIDELAILETLGPEKDVDGITPQSLGRLMTGQSGFRPATPLGMITLLDEYHIPLEGLRAVVLGRSVILGKPAALLLLERNATVTICHSKTRDLSEICKQADLIVAAVGKPELVRADWVKEGAIVLDAGYNKVPGSTHDVGDVAFDEVAPKASWITPVPGGVGPMTVTMLLANTVLAAEIATGKIQ